MIRLFLGIISLSFLATCQTTEESKASFSISGSMEGLEDGSAIIKRRVDGDWITLDSSQILNGQFKLQGHLAMPEMCYVFVSDTLSPIRVFVENSDINIKAKADSTRYAEISGSTIQDELDDYNSKMQDYNDQLSETYNEYLEAVKDKNEDKQKELDKKFEEVSDNQKEAGMAYVKEHSSSLIAPYLTWGTLVYDLSIKEMEELSNVFDPSMSESIYVKQLNDHITIQKKVSIGQPLTDIVLADTTGDDFALSSLKGNIILIDFWASWCGPCRRENPNVVGIYNDYNEKGFEILGVSFDEEGEAWKQAIIDDRLNWYHISDLKGWNSKGAELYGVRAIPHTVLIDRNGEIIAKNLRGDELREKIKELTQG
ncbi:thioredoxin-like domain-containing protein [Bacteroidota bacterium]